MEETNNASSTSLTLGGILSIKQTPPYRVHDQTLLDLIRNDQTSGNESKKMWKMFRDKFRLKLAGAICTTTVSNHTTTRNDTSTIRLISASPPVNDTSSVPNTQTVNEQIEPAEREQTVTEEGTGGEGHGDGGEQTAARMSLMSLLEVEASVYMNDDDDVEDAAVEDSGDGGGGGGYNNCCVCMVRHKGAAFIPCGHTFCRHCSRELFVKRANCPLCNHFILEILDIF